MNWLHVIRRVGVPLLISLILVWGVVHTAQALAQHPSVSPSPHTPAYGLQTPEVGERPVIMEVDSGGMVLELSAPEFELVQSSANGEDCQLIKAPGFGETGKPGWPRLPVKGTLVGIPQNAQIRLEVLAAETQLHVDHYAICPESQPIAEFDEQTGEALYNRDSAEKDPGVYSQDGFTPEQPAVLGEPVMLRSQRAIQVLFQPYQYNPVSGELRVTQRIRVRLSFENSQRLLKEAATPAVDEGAYETILRNSLVNYEMARDWREPTVKGSIAAPDALPSFGPQSYRLAVKTTGIYQVSYEALAAKGAAFSGIDPATIQLFSNWQEVAIQVQDGGDGVFDPGDYFLFYGQAIDSIYTLENVYFVTWGITHGLRMNELESAPGSSPAPLSFNNSVHLEQDTSYRTYYPSGPDQDVWYWNSISAVSTLVSRTYTTTLANVSTQPYTATVHGLIRSNVAQPFHYTLLYLNENLVEEAVWPSRTEHPIKVDVPQSYLVEGVNTLRLAASLGPTTNGITLSWNLIFVNWFGIDYIDTYVAENDQLLFSGQSGEWDFKVTGFSTDTVELYEVTDPWNVRRVISTSLDASASDVAAPLTSYDLRFHQALAGETKYLALSRANRLTPESIVEEKPSNLHAMTNGADWIMITHSSFMTGVLPLATWRSEQGYRTAVIEVQDIYDEFNGGLIDPEAIHNFLAYAYQNWQPPAPQYVLLMGDGHYDFRNNLKRNVPFFVPPYLAQADPWQGETAADNRYVTVSGSDTFPDMYLGRITVRTPEEAVGVVNKILGYEQNMPGSAWNMKLLFVADNYDPQAGDFPALSDVIVEQLHTPFTFTKVYLNVNYSDPALARSAITNAINEGRGIVNYVGHGSVRYWTKELIFGDRDFSDLSNSDRLPFIMAMTCLEGQYHSPVVTTLGHSIGEGIVRLVGKGAIGSWSPTGYGVASGHDYLNRGFFDAFLNRGITQLGPATHVGLLTLWTDTSGHRELIDTYILFGDPATKLQLPERYYFFPLSIADNE